MVHFAAKTGSHRVGCAQVLAPQWVTRANGRFEFSGQIAVLSVSRLFTRLRATDRTSSGSRRQGFWPQTSLSQAAQHPPPTAHRLPQGHFENQPEACHSERSEESPPGTRQTLRGPFAPLRAPAQGDRHGPKAFLKWPCRLQIAVLTCGPARGIVWVWGGWRALPGRALAPWVGGRPPKPSRAAGAGRTASEAPCLRKCSEMPLTSCWGWRMHRHRW